MISPELSLAHGGGGRGGGGHGFGGGEVLVFMVWAHPAEASAGAAIVRDSAGRVDFRVEVFLLGESTVASVIAVSVDL